MKQTEFEKLFNEFINELTTTLINKGKEYATEFDRLKNFKDAGGFLEITPEQALLGMVTKHLIALKDAINELEYGAVRDRGFWIEKTGDICAYLGPLLRGLLTDRGAMNTNSCHPNIDDGFTV